MPHRGKQEHSLGVPGEERALLVGSARLKARTALSRTALESVVGGSVIPCVFKSWGATKFPVLEKLRSFLSYPSKAAASS